MINRETWVKLIRDFIDFEIPELIERDIEIGEPRIKRVISVIGPRRSGKTFLLFQEMKILLEKGIEKKRILYVNFENDLLLGTEVRDLRNMIDIFYAIYPENKALKVYIFLDEIQNVPQWEKFVRSVMDNENAQLFISGSSSKLLSKEIATGLRGRTLPYHVYPFSFGEFLKAKDFQIGKYLSSREKAILLNLTEQYLKGSYPETIFFEKGREKILKEILDVTIYRDVIERFKVKNVKILKLLLKAAMSSTYFSVHKFYNYTKSLGMKVSKNTIYNYIDYFSDSFILFPLRKYSRSYKEIEQTIPKIYSVDNGLLTISGITDIGRLMENIVFMELVRRGFSSNTDLFYYESGHKEVDFVLRKGPMQLIQVCYSIDDFNTKEREIDSLMNASEKLRCRDLLVITWDYENTEKKNEKKIRFIPLWKWLLLPETSY